MAKKNNMVKRPSVTPAREAAKNMLDEKNDSERLHMTETSDSADAKKGILTVEEVGSRWRELYAKAAVSPTPTINTKNWSKLNPFTENTRLKKLYTQSKTYSKVDINKFLHSPGNFETELRSLGWANSSAQQIYYNILRRSCDIPLYNSFIIPPLLDKASDYKKEEFKKEDELLQLWLEEFDIKNTFKTIALEVKREGKSSYLLRNKFKKENGVQKPQYCTLQKLPTDWIKITGKGQLGYTISFNMAYFFNITSGSAALYGDFFEQAWNDLVNNHIVVQDPKTKKWSVSYKEARNYSFPYNGNNYHSILESKGGSNFYALWLQVPDDICFTFASDNSQPWVAPDTMGLMQKMQELTDYNQLAGLVASTPLTAVLTGEIETIANARAGKNESVYTPEVLKGWMDLFNSSTSTNVEAWLFPAKNMKLQQLSSDVNSSEIINTATQNFLESAGEGGLTTVTDKPNVAQVNVAKQEAASQQEYVTLQFNRVMNYIIQNKLGLMYRWSIRIWGDIFNQMDDKKFLKEVVAGGNIALLPKLMSAEGISMRDTKAMVEYIESLNFYKSFKTYTTISSAEEKKEQGTSDKNGSAGVVHGAGRPAISDDDIDNEATAKSREQGTNTSDNREH